MRRVIGWTALAVLLVVIAASAWVVTRVLAVNGEAQALATLEGDARTAIAKGDVGRLDAIAREFDTRTEAAAAAVGDPIWRAAEIVPLAGPNLQAIRVTVEQLRTLSTSVASPTAQALEGIGDRGLMADGAIDLAVVESLHETAARASTSLEKVRSRLNAISTGATVDQVRDGVDQARRLTTTLSASLGPMADITGVLPAVLGGDEERTILVMFQNNAELRSGGGITGSFAEIRAKNGALRLVRQADSSDFRPADEDVEPVPETTSAVYGDTVGRFVQNATSTPDFDLSGRLASTWWKKLTGHAPDVVIAIDPIVLRALLPVTGELTLPDGTALTHDTFVRDVLVDPYLALTGSEQSEYFAALTERYFTALTSSPTSPSAFFSALRTPVEQGRVSVWSAHDDEAAVFAASVFGGPRARHIAAGPGAFALYFNDSTGGKMDSRLGVAVGAVSATCRADNHAVVAVQVTLRNDAPADAGSRWPLSMTGGGHWGVEAGHIGTVVSAAAPSEWLFGGTRKNGELAGAVDVIDGGSPTSALEVDLAPGESVELEFRFVSPVAGAVEPTLLRTPLLRAADEREPAPLTCG
ncbi:DUF4012 domain-containing protein [Microbacterium sp. TNHR37B]|uniref:DUF4012 domain-containing protein n=1 Tax=Microbacterium sp. TNHR37B TaxID=1775956 RepID=UPI0008300ECC|nr:DUF4012 domain-containing protein [Microbacterium sp. TNHR37B]